MAAQPDILRAMRQVIGCLSRGVPVPDANTLVQSPLVTQALCREGMPDRPEYRQQALEEILHSIATEFGLEPTAGRRAGQRQQLLHDLMSDLLRGKRGRDRIPARTSYDRQHAEVIRMLADRFQLREEQLGYTDSDSSPPRPLRDARQGAESVAAWLDAHPEEIDLVRLDALAESAVVIEDHHRYAEARAYFGRMRGRLQGVGRSAVVLRKRCFAVTRLAHCQMVQDALPAANAGFAEAAHLAAQIGDRDDYIHAMHMRGVTYASLGQYNLSLRCLNEAARSATHAVAAAQRRAWIQRDMIMALIGQRDFVAVAPAARASLTLRESVGDAQGAMMTLEIWGQALIAQRQYPAAEDMLRKAQAVAADVPSPFFRAMLAGSFARLYACWDKPDASMAYIAEAESLAMRFGMWHKLNQLRSVRLMLEDVQSV